MANSNIETLSKIITTVDQFVEQLSSHISAQPVAVKRGASTNQCAPFLELPKVDHQEFLQLLNERNLSGEVASQIHSLYKKKTVELETLFQSQWQKIFSTTFSSISVLSCTGLSRAHVEIFLRHLGQLRQVLLCTIDNKLQAFCYDLAQSESESSATEDQLVTRGHSRLAVTILEKAYARTTNITRAEKIRLAAATKLKPRQVTIWFQNRRNRKTASSNSKTNAEATPPSSIGSTLSQTSRKRKAEGLYNGDIRHPSQRTRSSTPENSPEMSRDVYLSSISSSSSSISSVDSLASFFGGRDFNSAELTNSTDTTLADDDWTFKKQSNPVKTPICMSFDDQLKRQGLSSDSYQDIQQDDLSNSMLFSDAGVLQLDFDDLDLDLESLASDLPSFNLKDFDFVIPNSSSNIIRRDTSISAIQGSFATPNVPTSPYDAAAVLNSFDFTVKEAVAQAQQKEGWALDGSPVLEQSSSNDELDWFLSLQGLSPGSAASPNTQTSTIEGSTSNENSAAATPQDFFNFSVEGLFLDNIFEQNLESFRISDEDEEMSPAKNHLQLSLDTNSANHFPVDDAMKTARQQKTLFE